MSKPVGTAVVGRTLFVSDQATGKLLSFPLDTLLVTSATAAQGTTVATFTTTLVSGDPGTLTADNIELMSAAADGMLFHGRRGPAAAARCRLRRGESAAVRHRAQHRCEQSG